MKQELLKTYIRKENKQPRGIAVAVKNGDKIDYGFSLLNTTLDKWDKKIGTQIAVNRATRGSYRLPEIKEREEMVLEAFRRLEARSLKYFKDMNPDDISLDIFLGSEE